MSGRFSKSFAAALMALNTAFSSAAAAEDMTSGYKRPSLETRTTGDHSIIARPEILSTLGPLADALVKQAGQPVILVDHTTFKFLRTPEWSQLPPFLNAFAGNRDDFSGILDLLNGMLNDRAEKYYYTVGKRAFENRGGKNFHAENFDLMDGGEKKGCVIMGDPDAPLVSLVSALSGLKPDIAQKIASGFDRRSIVALILLHEAAHCGQNLRTLRILDSQTLALEIDADEKAAQAYGKLVEEHAGYDGDMPGKARQMRILSSVLKQPALAALSLLNFTHTTAHAPENASPAEKADRARNNAMMHSVYTYIMVSSALTPQQAEDLRPQIDKEMDTIDALLDKAAEIMSTKGDNGKNEIKQALQTMFRQAITGLVAVIEWPEYAYYADRMVLEEDRAVPKLPNPDPSLMDDIKNASQQFVTAWETLNLPKSESDFAFFKKRIQDKCGGSGSMSCLVAPPPGPSPR